MIASTASSPKRASAEQLRASVIIVSHNHTHVLARCLEALESTLAPNDEVILADNASVDGTPDLVVHLFPRARLIRLTQNLGFGGANNAAAAVSRGRYLVFLNPDTVPLPGWLDALLGGFVDGERTGLTTAKLLLPGDPPRIDAYGNDVHISGITTCRHWGERALTCVQPERVSAVSGACFAVPSALFVELGAFDERLFLYFEDTEFSLRARLAGYRCVAVPSAEVIHEHAPGFSPEKLRYLERNRWWTLLKLLRWRTLFALTPVLAIGELVAWAFAIRQGPEHVAAKVRAWLELVGWLFALPEARAQAAAVRTRADFCITAKHRSRLNMAEAQSGALTRAAEHVLALVFSAARKPLLLSR